MKKKYTLPAKIFLAFIFGGNAVLFIAFIAWAIREAM